MNRRAGLAPVVVTCVFAIPLAVTVIASVWWPFGLDQGLFAWAGDVILRGGVPYQDAWELKSPLIHYTYALAQLLFGPVTWGVRTLDLGSLAVVSFALWRLGRPEGTLCALAMAFVFVSSHVGLGFWNTALPDAWAGMALLVALCVTSGDAPSVRRCALAGALVGIAALFKLPYLALGLAIAVQIATSRPSEHRWRNVLWMSAGVAAVLAACAAWFLAHGALDELIDVQFRFNPLVYQSVQDRSGAQHLRAIGQFLGRPAILAQLPFAVLGAMRLRSVRPSLLLGCTAWLVVGTALVVIQNKYYAYHWAILTGPLCVLVGFGVSAAGPLLHAAANRLSLAARSADAVHAIVVAILLALLLPAIELVGWQTYVFQRYSRAEYYTAFMPEWAFGPIHELRLAEYLREHTQPDQQIVIWGLAPGVHFLSGRTSPSRFAFNLPLIVGEETGFRERYRREFMESLRTAPPEYVVVATGDRNNLFKGTSIEHLRDFGELRRFISKRYLREGQIDHFQVWRKRQARPSAADGAS